MSLDGFVTEPNPGGEHPLILHQDKAFRYQFSTFGLSPPRSEWRLPSDVVAAPIAHLVIWQKSLLIGNQDRGRTPHVAELLTKTLENVHKNVGSAVADAEAELERLRVQCEQLQELIGIGRATISAAKRTSLIGHRPAETSIEASNAQLGDSEHVIKELQKHLS